MNVDAIIVGDIHLRDDQPECWIDNYFSAQADAIRLLGEMQNEHDCPIFAPGDIFHKWNASHELVSYALSELPPGIIAIAGQHDLRNHRIENLSKSALSVLISAGHVRMPLAGSSLVLGNSDVLSGFSWESKLSSGRRKSENEQECRRKIAMCHIMTYKTKNPYHGIRTDSASRLLKKMAGFDLLVTGDNHESFVVREEGRLLVNAGSMMRMRADQMNHKPRFYLWDGDKNEVEPVYLPYKKEAITRKHIDSKENRDERIEAFVNRLKKDIEIGFSYEDNLEKFMMKANTEPVVQQMVHETLEV